MPRPTQTVDFRPIDPNEKKLAILAVVSFNDANDVPYSRAKVSEYFDVNERTARKWCATAASTAASTAAPTCASNSASTSASRPAQCPETYTKPPGSRVIKRARSEDEMAELLSSTVKSGAHKPGQNNEQGRKKCKVKDEASSASPPPLQQSLTPPRRKIPQPRKQRQAMSTEPSVDFGWENSDEYTEA